MIDFLHTSNEKFVFNSLDVAHDFRKRHSNVTRAIENLIAKMPKNYDSSTFFKKTFFIEEQNGQEYPMYLMNRDGFMLLVMGFTGKKAQMQKLKYIKSYNTMEQLCKNRSAQY